MALVAMALAGCGREEIQTYRIPKESRLSMAQAGLPAGHPPLGESGTPTLTWKRPDGWEEVPPGQMRVASFNVKGPDGKVADVSVVPLGGGAGGDLANVNRWRTQQLGLDAVTPDELKKLAEPVEIGGRPADLYDLAGKNPASGEPTRILGAIQHRDGTAWFFKMTGDDALVAAQKPAFVEFLRSVQFGTGGGRPRPIPTSGELPPGHPPLETAGSAGPARATSAAEVKPRWSVPEGWQEVPGGEFLVAKFQIRGEGGAAADVNVSRSAGDGGGLAANVNRWRRQLGLEEMEPEAIARAAREVPGEAGPAVLVELKGTDARTGKSAAVVGAMVMRPGESWFYKLMGDPALVEAQKVAFETFVRSARY
ncbi:MAG: hypothetical protein RMK20_06510 [Verrucomicrobiales bacterium]|nr:hypothetical protein [Verrucomicrobiales bacterium]